MIISRSLRNSSGISHKVIWCKDAGTRVYCVFSNLIAIGRNMEKLPFGTDSELCEWHEQQGWSENN